MGQEYHEELNREECGCTFRYYFKGDVFIRKNLEDFCAEHEKAQIDKVNSDMRIQEQDPLRLGP